MNLSVPPGSFVTLLGPSGSGKTTTLNLIAGFLDPDAGEVYFDDRPMSGVPPNKRDIGMVFQSYALFPHMTVFDNVAFPLRMRRKGDTADLQMRVTETLDLVRLGKFETRYPKQLSGGQQQRVAMARALVSHPSLLLMDEPLGALDKKLREELQLEIKGIHRRVGSTFVYVTHDQSEALTMSDLVVVMNEGEIVQVGDPKNLYRSPQNEFVADFLGGANVMTGTVVRRRGANIEVALATGATIVVVSDSFDVADGGGVQVVVRPEDIDVVADGPGDSDDNALAGIVAEFVYLGDSAKVLIEVNNEIYTAKQSAWRTAPLEPGQSVHMMWPNWAAHLIAKPKGSGKT